MPPMMPQGGQTQGGDIAAQLQQLIAPILQSPKGQQMAQAIMAQMGGGGGGDPRSKMATAMPGGPGGIPMQRGGGSPAGGGEGMGGAGPGGDGDLNEMDVAQQENVRSPMGQPPIERGGYGPYDDGGQPSGGDQMTTEQELAMAQQQMGSGSDGGGMPNTGGLNAPHGGPTPEEIRMLQSKPSPMNMQNFDKLFGQGAAERVMMGGAGPDDPAHHPDEPATGGSDYDQ